MEKHHVTWILEFEAMTSPTLSLDLMEIGQQEMQKIMGSLGPTDFFTSPCRLWRRRHSFGKVLQCYWCPFCAILRCCRHRASFRVPAVERLFHQTWRTQATFQVQTESFMSMDMRSEMVDAEIFIWELIIVFQVAQNHGKRYSELPKAIPCNILK